MTTEEWINKALESREDLSSLVSRYHPSNYSTNPVFLVDITAPTAEAACDVVRDKIRSEVKQDPSEMLSTAFDSRDFSTIYKLLSDAWFGVPESTSCWSIPGFGIACDLLDDPPEDQEDVEPEEETN